MSEVDPVAVAMNAAGIADALACLGIEDLEATARFDRVAEKHGGRVGILQEVVRAAELMERFRASHGVSATWGGELPYLYDVWDAIARAIWLKLDCEPLERVIASAIQSSVEADVSPR